MRKKFRRGLILALSVVMVTSLSIGANIPVGGVSQVNYQFSINDSIVKVPDHLTVMSKNNTTYVPLRFLSETMGLEVDYMPGTVVINSEEHKGALSETSKQKIELLEKEVEKLKEEKHDLEKRLASINSQKFYKKLPAFADSGDGLRITVTGFDLVEDGMKVYITMENSDLNNRFFLNPVETKLVVDGNEYNATYKSDGRLGAILTTAHDENSPRTEQGFIHIEGIEEKDIKGELYFVYKEATKEESTIQILFDNKR